MFGRKKKDSGTVGVVCPYCEHNNPLGAETCEQCYYSLNKSAREQPMAEPTTSGEEIMSLLLGENEEEEDIGPVVEAVLALDDVTVEVDQYAATTAQDEDGEPVPETFEFIGSEGPTLSSTVESSEPEEVELTAEDAPKEYAEFDLGNVNPMDEVAEPIHTGKGGLYSPTVETPKDEDLLGDVGPAPSATPDLPDLPEDTTPELETSHRPSQHQLLRFLKCPLNTWLNLHPDLPDLPDDDVAMESSPAEPVPAQLAPPSQHPSPLRKLTTVFGRGQRQNLGRPHKFTRGGGSHGTRQARSNGSRCSHPRCARPSLGPEPRHAPPHLCLAAAPRPTRTHEVDVGHGGLRASKRCPCGASTFSTLA